MTLTVVAIKRVLQNNAKIFALHLRLGRNLIEYFLLDEILRVQRLTPLSETSPYSDWMSADIIYAVYPRRLLSIFGAPLHLEGLVARRSDLVADLSPLIVGCESPGCIEERWISSQMNVHSQQWQASHTAVFQNMYTLQGRIYS